MKRLADIKKVLISRTDSLGDVILTLPMAGLLKEMFPEITIYFLGKKYTAPLLEQCSFVDEIITMEELMQGDLHEQVSTLRSFGLDAIIHVYPTKMLAHLAYKAGIPVRIGSTGRLYHYVYCNKLVPLSRRRSTKHEAELNTILLKPFGYREVPDAENLAAYFGLNISSDTTLTTFNIKHPAVILHPGSKGSAREWSLAHFARLSEQIQEAGAFVYLTGSEEEGKMFRPMLCSAGLKAQDLSGCLSLKELIWFIANTDALVAASTGPLHIAASLGKLAIGIYPPIRPMHPGRWRPIGTNSHYLVLNKECNYCRKGQTCHCMQAISPDMVFKLIERELLQKGR